MDGKQREQFMKDVVLPKSKELFVAFDAKFADMNCKTCHGDGAEDGSFEMPNPKIKPLPNSEEGFMAWIAKEPDEGRWAGFMAQKLEPAVAEMLGEKPFDPKTKTGEFGCANCHELIDASGNRVPHEKHDHDHK